MRASNTGSTVFGETPVRTTLLELVRCLEGMGLGEREVVVMATDLVDSGRAVWLGDGHPPAEPPPLEDVARAVARVRALVTPAPSRASTASGYETSPASDARDLAPAPRP